MIDFIITNLPLILCFAALIFIFSPAITILYEKKDYNEGYCPHCGKKLKLDCTDSQGGRCYTCKKCGYITWVTYRCVDGGIKRK